jgi:hypothetical protein
MTHQHTSVSHLARFDSGAHDSSDRPATRSDELSSTNDQNSNDGDTSENVRHDVEVTLYRVRDERGVLLYVGVTNTPMLRLESHTKSAVWSLYASSVTFERYMTRDAVLDAERNAIIDDRPVFNKIHSPLDDEDISSYIEWRRILGLRVAQSNREPRKPIDVETISSDDVVEQLVPPRVERKIFLSEESLARRWDMSVYDIKNMIRREQAPPYLIMYTGSRKNIRFRLSDVEDWEDKMSTS